MESIIFNVNEVNKVNFSEVIQTPQTLVYSVNKDKTYVTWLSPTTPSFVSTILTAEGPYNDDQLHAILERREWLLIV
jgi:hypothetical protein